MQIHELTLPKIKEGIGDFLGLNNPNVKQAWNQTLGGASATKDPAKKRQQSIVQDASDALEDWKSQVEALETRLGRELTRQEYANSLYSWIDRAVFKRMISTNRVPQDQLAKIKQAVQSAAANSKNNQALTTAFQQLVGAQYDALAQAFTNPAAAAAPAAAEPAADVPQTVMPAAGKRIAITHPRTGGKYYKTEKGWFNELNQPVVDAASIERLDNIADISGREEDIPTAPTPGRQVRPRFKGPRLARPGAAK